ncbi:hypothetical protein HDF14_003593 [Edaphobacter lichenicola]|uniref:Uncharacterized protein n=1 Tax=Tunturiibacter gelidiferens TaxID=3069689 RepID=A0A9X0U4Z8_9BACT|nr:hypothetical protein [Edaphobacter lichenicola]
MRFEGRGKLYNRSDPDPGTEEYAAVGGTIFGLTVIAFVSSACIPPYGLSAETVGYWLGGFFYVGEIEDFAILREVRPERGDSYWRARC